MIRKLCCAIAISAVTVLPAHGGIWNFSYKGFYHEETQTWLPDQMLPGAFTGTDKDGDGVLVSSELDYFMLANNMYWAYYFNTPEGWACGDSGCNVDSFSYNLSSKQLSFEAYDTFLDAYYFGSQHCISNDRCVRKYSGAQWDWENTQDTLRWTDDTVFTISGVPEPTFGAMAGAGALLLGALRLRYRGRKSGQ